MRRTSRGRRSPSVSVVLSWSSRHMRDEGRRGASQRSPHSLSDAAQARGVALSPTLGRRLGTSGAPRVSANFQIFTPSRISTSTLFHGLSNVSTPCFCAFKSPMCLEPRRSRFLLAITSLSSPHIGSCPTPSPFPVIVQPSLPYHAPSSTSPDSSLRLPVHPSCPLGLTDLGFGLSRVVPRISSSPLSSRVRV